MTLKKTFALAPFFLALTCSLFSQEALKSAEEEYYDFLSLQGLVERPTLGYRTLSDSEWKFIEKESPILDEDGNPILDENGNPVMEKTLPQHVWQNNTLGKKRTLWQSNSKGSNWFTKGFDHSIKFKAYGPEWYNSFNTAAPYGQNDVALWQGKGYNTSLTGGARLEGYGFELTVKPQVCFSQNLGFKLMDNSAYYTNKYAYIWGYGKDKGVDAPQRFGDSSFWTYDWGDTEARWTWHTFTAGFGTQSIWLGPAWLNPLLHSNNAATYPKFDIGLRKTEIFMPFFGWDLGAIEARLWIGRTTESDYFDNDSSNDHNQITGITFSYAPSFLPGLTLGVNKICMSKWDTNKAIKYLNPLYDVNDDEDQKFSFIADWIFPKVGFEVYGELGVDDYFVGWHTDYRTESLIRNPFHTMTFSVGLKKSVTLSKRKNIYGKIIFEWNTTEMSQDFQFEWPYNFGFHHITTQGYTNKGQWLGSGIGYGGNSQILAFDIFYQKGDTLFFIWRNNPDNNYIYSKTLYTSANSDEGKALYQKYYVAYKANFNIGIVTNYFVTKNLKLNGGFVYNLIMNSQYNPSKIKETSFYTVVPDKIHNFQIQLGAKYYF